jgi:hypothetical protein
MKVAHETNAKAAQRFGPSGNCEVLARHADVMALVEEAVSPRAGQRTDPGDSQSTQDVAPGRPG